MLRSLFDRRSLKSAFWAVSAGTVLTISSAFSTALFGAESDAIDSNAPEKTEYFEKFFPAPENPAPDRLAMAAEWRIWIPAEVETLRGVVVHQHGCGDGSGDGGRTAVFDLHWRELARKHDCALIAVSYRLGDLPCNLWCDPRNGSAQSFLDALDYFADESGHSELKSVPWALWGHSGGGQWVGSMVQLFPERVAGAWLRSGCPDTVVRTFDELPMKDAVKNVPIMLNIGAFESDMSIVWGSCWPYFAKMRERGAKIGFIVDPKTHHETGDSRYPAIRFLDDCLTARLPLEAGSADLRPTPEGVVLPVSEISDAELSAENIVKDPAKPDGNYDAAERREFLKAGIWLPNAEYVDVWRKYSLDASFDDATPPPAPTDVRVDADGLLTWKQRADLESGLRTFVVYRNGEELATLPTAPVCNGRPAFQGVMYSDTPDYSLPKLEYRIENYDPNAGAVYSVAAVNTNGLKSEPTPESGKTEKIEKTEKAEKADDAAVFAPTAPLVASACSTDDAPEAAKSAFDAPRNAKIGNAARLAAPKKKLIELGWDIPTTDYIRRHWAEMEANAPFDGVVYDLVAKAADGRTCASQSLFTADRWNAADFDKCVDDLNACGFKRYFNNFIRINFYPAPFDWADDDAWDAVSEKAAICARVARETNGGLCLDFESYGAEIFRFDAATGRTFDESKALVRRRGAQFGGAIVAEYPNVVLLALWLNSINFSAGRSATADAALAGSGYGLLPSFVDGLLDAATPETTLVDGCENGYYMNGAAQYARTALDIVSATGPGAALVSPENRAKYRAQVQAGFGFYLDMYSNPEGSTYYRGPEPGETRFDRLVANLTAAWDAADEYVWVYGEQKRWWPVDSDASQAEAPATKGQSWEDALPGITDAILELTAPNESLASDLAKRLAAEEKGETSNCVVDGDFAESTENSDGSATFANWGTWLHERSGGAFVSIGGKAALRGVQEGCYIQSFPVEPGERALIAAKVKSTGNAAATVTARWQDKDGRWTAEPQDVRFGALTDSEPDANGFRQVVGRVVVPESARNLVVLLSSSGAGPDDVVVFDDVRAYRPAGKAVGDDAK